jgi:hypothetical protein
MTSEFLATLFGLNLQVLKINTQGLSHEESLIQPKPAGNCLNWILGHIAVTRDQALALLGEKPTWNDSDKAIYIRGSKAMTDGSKAIRMEKIMADIERSQEILLGALLHQTPESLAASDDKGTVADKLAMLHFHEAYHTGQVGLMRRLVGKEGAIR